MEPVRLTGIKVREAMSPAFCTATLNTPARQVVELAVRCGVDEVLIVDDEGRLKGFVTKKQLLRDLAQGGLADEVKVSEIMVPDAITTSPEEDLNAVRALMREARIGRVPVVDETGRVVGILSAMHICNGFSEKLEGVGLQLQAILDTIEEAVVAVGLDGTVMYSNDRAQQVYGLSEEEIIGRPISDLDPEGVALQVLNTGKGLRNVYFSTPQGKHFLKSAVPIVQAGKLAGVVCIVQDVTKVVKLVAELSRAKDRIVRSEWFGGGERHLVEVVPTESQSYARTLEHARRVAATDATVLIVGESGTGKEVMANAIHYWSPRRNKPFVVIDCAAIPESLFESELFGYAGGAFTGAAKQGRPGKFELADGGTVFLDEIGELPLDMQSKLLRVLEGKAFYRIGSTNPVTVDVRIIAATNRDLEDMVEKGTFRGDLYYRLKVFTLRIPPLRERKNDIPALTTFFLREFAAKYGRKPPTLAPRVVERLKSCQWRGNIRELRNFIERLVLLCDKDDICWEEITAFLQEDSLDGAVSADQRADGKGLNAELGEREKEIIVELLKQNNNNKAKVARILKIPRSTLYYRMKILGIE